MNDTLFSLNGRIVPAERAVVPVTDRAFLYGDGLFETLHAYGRKLFRLDRHLQRLTAGAQRLSFDPQPDPRLLARWLNEAVVAANFPEANVRLTLSRGSGPRGPSIPPSPCGRGQGEGLCRPTTVITVTRYRRPPDAALRKGATAILASFRRQEAAVLASLKTLNYLEQILARREADLAGADEAILLNNAGLVSEGSASNVAVVREGRILVPDPARSGALAGITQTAVLDCARALRIPVLHTLLSPWNLQRADEAFLTGSMREVTPLVRIGQTTIGSGHPGPITLRLIAAYRRLVHRECRPFRYSPQ
jgi:branched-chain amino acid aminotransferase